MSAAFDPVAWVQRAEAIGLARVLEEAINISAAPVGPVGRGLLDEWWGGSEEQRKLNTRAACDYVRTLGDPARKYHVVGEYLAADAIP